METLKFADDGSVGIGGPCPEQILDISGEGYVGIAGEFGTQPNHKLEVSIGNLNPNQKLEVVSPDENKEALGLDANSSSGIFDVFSVRPILEYKIDYEKIKTIEDVVEVFKIIDISFSADPACIGNNRFENSPYLKLKEDLCRK